MAFHKRIAKGLIAAGFSWESGCRPVRSDFSGRTVPNRSKTRCIAKPPFASVKTLKTGEAIR